MLGAINYSEKGYLSSWIVHLLNLRRLKAFTLSLLFIGCFFWSAAQQAPHFSMYMLNKHQANPGYAGFDESLSATGVYRQQWVELIGAPELIHFDVHLPLLITGGGIGLNIDNEKIGARNNSRIALSYSYWLEVNKKVKVGLGLRAGLHQMSIDGAALRAPEGDYNFEFNHNDPFLPLTKTTSQAPEFGAGIHIVADRLNAGVAVQDLAEGKIEFNVPGGTLNYNGSRTYQAYAEYELELGSYFIAKPSIMFRSDLVQHELHFGGLLEYDGRFFAGGTFRGYNMVTEDAFAIIFGASLNEKLSLAYAYDITLSAIQSVSRGSHEILLNYNLGKPIGNGKLPNIIYNPRF